MLRIIILCENMHSIHVLHGCILDRNTTISPSQLLKCRPIVSFDVRPTIIMMMLTGCFFFQMSMVTISHGDQSTSAEFPSGNYSWPVSIMYTVYYAIVSTIYT